MTMRACELAAGLIVLTMAAATHALVDSAPVTVHASPRLAYAGMTITIKGTSGIDAVNAKTVKVVVTAPGAGGKEGAGKQFTLLAPITPDGDFSTSFTDTKIAGVYNVLVTSPGGGGQAPEKFEIIPGDKDLDDFDEIMSSLIESADQGVAQVKNRLAPFPESTDKVEAQKKLETLETRVKEIRRSVSLSQIIKPLGAHVSRVPVHVKRVEPLLHRLTEWETKARAEQVRINQELITSAREGERCEKIDQAIEAVNLVSALLNLIADPLGIITGFAQDLLTSTATSSDADSLTLKTATNLVKASSGQAEILVGPSQWTTRPTVSRAQLSNSAVGLAFDLSNLFFKGYYGKYCERLEGPLSGQMIGQVAKDGVPYWKFRIGLKGKIVLRYAKPESAGTAVRVRGQLMGFGTDFWVEEDMVRVLFPEKARDASKGGVIIRKVRTPAVTIASDAWNALLAPQGTIAQTLGSPTAFYIPVEGDLVKDTLTLRVQDARFDFDEKKTAAHALYFLVGPLGTTFFDNPLPYQNAHHIIIQSMNARESRTAELKVGVDSAARRTTVARDFTRDFKNEGATATYTLNLKACNPACQ